MRVKRAGLAMLSAGSGGAVEKESEREGECMEAGN